MNVSDPGMLFWDADASHYAGFKAHATTTASVIYTWPAAPPTSNGYILSSTTAGVMSWVANAAGAAVADNTASIGLSRINGVAATAMRSDGAPPLDVGIAPTWTGAHVFQSGTTSFSSTLAYNTPPAVDLVGVLKYNSGGSTGSLAKITFGKENTTDGNDAGFIDFYTRTNGGSNTRRMRIDSTGRVYVPSVTADRYVKTDGDNYLSGDQTEAANTVFAGPFSGSNAVPTFKSVWEVMGDTGSGKFSVNTTDGTLTTLTTITPANNTVTFVELVVCAVATDNADTYYKVRRQRSLYTKDNSGVIVQGIGFPANDVNDGQSAWDIQENEGSGAVAIQVQNGSFGLDSKAVRWTGWVRTYTRSIAA